MVREVWSRPSGGSILGFRYSQPPDMGQREYHRTALLGLQTQISISEGVFQSQNSTTHIQRCKLTFRLFTDRKSKFNGIWPSCI